MNQQLESKIRLQKCGYIEEYVVFHGNRNNHLPRKAKKQEIKRVLIKEIKMKQAKYISNIIKPTFKNQAEGKKLKAGKQAVKQLSKIT